ncbi:YciI family protein [Kineobactrum salinum]|uniref:YciI family protein n=1 Tax=Kineobactrum salinum TaxID=2708301 RepID=A0A6C0U216_9GAMM|nr:YciI family protein [Kineobactrum salinum]QIB66192.1 YciI family protein [Kineobactrum salinum]
MKYLAMVYYQEGKMRELSQQEWDVLNRECMACVEGLQQAGHFLAGEALQSTDTATTLRVRDGQVATTDGPFAETREQLAGFYMLEARDMEEAVELASRIPPARYGSVELRPVRELRTENNDQIAGAKFG